MNLLNKLDNVNVKELTFRIITLILSSLFFAYIPVLIFLIYMGHHGFFSYDFFSEGVFGLKVFFLLTSVIMLIMSLGIFGFLLMVFKMVAKKIESWDFSKLIGCIIFNSLVFITILGDTNIREYSFDEYYFLSICFCVCAYVACLIFAKPSAQFFFLVAMIFCITFLSLNLREQTSLFLGLGLKTYGVGGEIDVELTPGLMGQEDALTGKLLLSTPQNIYIKLNCSDQISIISRSKYDVITTIKDTDNQDCDSS